MKEASLLKMERVSGLMSQDLRVPLSNKAMFIKAHDFIDAL